MAAMTRRARFLAAVAGTRADRVPMFDFLFQRPLYTAVIGRTPESYNARDAVECALALDHDAVWIPLGAGTGSVSRAITEDIYQDEWGTTYRKNFASWPIDAPIDYPVTSRADLAGFAPPDPGLPGREAGLREATAMPHDDIAICGGVGGPFTQAWMMSGYERLAFWLYDDPGLVTELFGIAVEYGREAARRSVAAGADAVWISDDLGDSTRGFLSIEHFRRFYLPYLFELVDAIDGLGVPALLHCCGHFQEYLPDLAQTRIAALHPLQRTAGWDLRAAKETWGKRFCLIGNIDSSRTLPFGTPADVAAEVREALAIAAPGGGYVLASDHSLHDGIPLENIRTLFRVGREHGGYTSTGSEPVD